jgi:cytochrome c
MVRANKVGEGSYRKHSFILSVILLLTVLSCEDKQKPRILVFSKTAGYRHESIEPGKLALVKLGTENNFDVDTTEDASMFSEEKLKGYRAVIFLSTTQNVLDPVQQADFKRFIEAGGGYVGIHAAADTEYEWPWYGKLVGAYFKSHPQIQEARIKKVKSFGPKTLPDTWVRTDEWYNYKSISPDIQVIYTLDETSYKGGENGDNHPIAWYHEFEGGRAFYTGLGHTNESYSDSLFLEHILQGINYALGGNEPLNYDAVKTKRAPEENRFAKMVLDFNLDEPTEMTILPDGRILFIERKGNVKLYTPSTNKVSVINTLSPWTKYEDGLIGLASDPDFATNNFIYLYYSHPERSSNVLSRFVFKGDKLDLTSEKEILEVPTQRDKCCHTGGSLQFGKDRILFISTGDNTSPFESNGFSPSDERPGRSPFDAQKSSSNTNDLRGKILRIHIDENGTYSIPEGNLFPKGEPKTRPEIYVMGNRNPYRISIDSRSGYLYWGEVGPDAGKNDSLRGPRGYDEINQAKKAGFFGWPYFIGNNFSYSRYDFEAKKVMERWDPAKPINDSPNNTGKRELPPAQPAFIWYPYDKSEEFPMVKEGGRNAMAGPIYYSDEYNGAKTAFPEYLDGKILIYDWMRNWMFHVSLDDNGNMKDMEPFMEHTKFNNIIDMAYGPDGRLYMLEYGSIWFKQNMDARLVRIDYNGGNRAPVVQLAADKLSGGLPLTVNFSGQGSTDFDGDELSFEFQIGDKKISKSDYKYSYTFDKAGVYDVTLIGKDEHGLANQAMVKVTAGNDPPVVDVAILDGNKTFYFPGSPVSYEVKVNDKEDGSSEAGSISSKDVKVTFDYLEGYDMTGIARGHQAQLPEHPGKSLIDKSDCKSCHLVDQKSAGPGYKEVAMAYNGQNDALDKLAGKIIRGGAGVWGTTEMAAHPQISIEDARKMVRYILSLANDVKEKTLPLKGAALPEIGKDGVYMIAASYTDRPVNNVGSLSATNTIALRAPFLKPDQASQNNGGRVVINDGMTYWGNVKHNSFARYDDIDVSGIGRAMFTGFINEGRQAGGEMEIHFDKPDGPLWGKAKITGQGLVKSPGKLEPQTGVHALFVVFKNPEAGDKTLFAFGGIEFLKK